MVCNQLGFPYVEEIAKQSSFGAAFPPFSYQYLYCNGDELKLDNCRRSDSDTSYCSGEYKGAGDNFKRNIYSNVKMNK